MSWIEDIQAKLIIKTGDGKEYSPLWLNASKVQDYHVTEFNFPNVSGTLVDRREPLGVKYNLEVYFQGEDFREQVEAFHASANDPRAWVVSHPLYGQITVQPLSLTFDLTKYNTAQITGTIMETIVDDNPKTTVVPQDKILTDKTDGDLSFRSSFANDVTPDAADIIAMTSNTDAGYQTAKSIAPPEQSEEYFNLYNEANAAIINATAEPSDAIGKIQAFINYPAMFEASVRSRVDMFVTQISDLNDTVENITTKSGKKIYEVNGGCILSAMALAAANPLTGGLGSRIQVIYVIDQLYYYYNLYMALLDTLQSTNGGTVDSYIPDHDSILKLNALIDYTIANLIIMSLGAKQERILYLEDDSNIILLAHRFYGLKEDDSTIDEFIENNGIGLNEMLTVKKGRKIQYYI